MSESLSVPSNVVADSSMGDSSTPGPSSQSASDPTLSLRAVALSTLKSKRRKPASTQSQTPTLPPRSVLADNSVQLDYGQDDQDASSSAVKPPANSAQHGPEDDGQPREEGEISDSEEAQLALAASGQQKASVEAPPPSPPKLPQASPSVDARSGNTTSPTTASLKQEPSPPPSNLLERISGPEPPVSSSNAHRRDSSISSTVVDDMDVDQPPHNPHIVDENHVRPGLLMNQKQYDAAKDIILDLLGWGVPPSYLLDCGLSREIVFYVFTELNLRLPDGINPNDFVPYNPTTVAMLVRGVNVPPGGLPNLPRKSISLTNGHLATSHMSPMSPSMLPSPDVSNLNDMEKLRRQELLARKAVHASRKGKGARSESSLMTPSTSHNRDVEMASTAIPTETVDDFLKTIDPVDETPRTQPGNDDRMDVDTSVHQTEDPLQNNYSPIETPSSAEAQHMDFDPPSRRSSSSASSGGTQRRTGKRPVAADFVDFESGPRHRNGHPHPHLKRKQEGSFASISTTRRCVIDLSDDEDGVQDDQSHFNSRTSGYNTPGLMVPTTKAEGTGFNTPPVSTASSTPRTMSPGALAEKEKEIARMRQMIAERERIAKGIKFKKINTQTSVDDGNDDAHTLASATTVSVKQEEGDVPLHSAKTNDADTMVIDTSNGTTELPKESMDGDPDRDSEASSTASTPPPIEHPQDTTNVPQSTTLTPTHAEGKLFVSTSQAQESQAKDSVDVDPNTSSSAQATPMISQHLPRLAENQVQSQKKPELDEYPRYNSLFAGYPLLRSLPTDKSATIPTPENPDSSSSSSPSLPSLDPSNSNISSSNPDTSIPSFSSSHPSSSLPSSFVLPDLKPLRIAALMQVLDPTRPICQYEIPGGGVCRDPGCEDNHLSRMGSGSGSTQNLFSQRYQPSVVEPSDQDTAQYLADSWGCGDNDSLKQKIITALEDVRSKNPTVALEDRVSQAITLVQSTATTT